MSNFCTAFEKDFVERAETETVSEAVYTIVERSDSNASASYPTLNRLSRLMRYLGVRRVSYLDIPCDGFLIPNSDGTYDIQISTTISRSRQRFSLAHELGHIFLHKLMPETRTFARRTVFHVPGSEAEERICDMFAAHILMPAGDVDRFCWGKDLAISLIEDVARRFEVSLSAASRRISELYGSIDFAVVEFDMGPNGTIPIRRIFSNFRQRRLSEKVVCRGNNSSVFHQAVAERRKAEGWEWVVQTAVKRRLLYCSVEPRRRDSGVALLSTVGPTQESVRSDWAMTLFDVVRPAPMEGHE